MNKLFLTMALAFSTLVASAQFSVITTISENADSAWTITEKLGVGYSLHLWKGLCFCPNYTLSLKEDEAGEREGKLNLGLTYKF